MQAVLECLKKELVGKEFIYVSKYGGETKGVVKDVNYVLEAFTPLKEQSNFNYKNTHFKRDFRVRSTNGNTYSLKEIYVKEILKNHE